MVLMLGTLTGMLKQCPSTVTKLREKILCTHQKVRNVALPTSKNPRSTIRDLEGLNAYFNDWTTSCSTLTCHKWSLAWIPPCMLVSYDDGVNLSPTRRNARQTQRHSTTTPADALVALAQRTWFSTVATTDHLGNYHATGHSPRVILKQTSSETLPIIYFTLLTIALWV